MVDKILVTYSSRTGYTAGVAEAIGKTLSEAKVQVDVLSMKDVKDLPSYSAYVIGSAIQGAKWLPEAIQFIETNKSVLEVKPCAMFTVCMTLAMTGGEKYRNGVAEWVRPARSISTSISGPGDISILISKVRPTDLRVTDMSRYPKI